MLFLLILLQAESLSSASWREEEVGAGVVWRYAQFKQLYGSPQSVSVLEAELDAKVRIRFAAPAQGKERTSALAAKTKAIAAVNGGFFNVKTGEPNGLLKMDGKTVATPTATTWAIGVDARERILIQAISPGDWKEVVHGLSSHPMLVEKGRSKRNAGGPRHPRTAAGLTAKNRLVLVTVDGRTPEAAGMTEEELAQTMIQLGCTTALNLDGGGSTTMWVRGESDGGVVNFPCDDKKFDHAGERAVANAVLVIAPDVIVAGRDEAKVSGDTVQWSMRVEWAGSYDVSTRWPKGKTLSGTLKVGRTEFKVDSGKGGEWVAAGTVQVESAGAIEVELRAAVAADAVRFVEK